MKSYELENIDRVLDHLVRLKGQFGVILYLLNLEGARSDPPFDDVKNWLGDIRNRLDTVIEMLT